MIFKSDFVHEMSERGFIHQCSNIDSLDKLLSSGYQTAYLGSDPTADSLHVGHLVPIMMMRWFQKYGNKPILLIGSATGRIGDPSGRDTSRPVMTEENIKTNALGLKKSFSKFFDFSGSSSAILVDNYDWFKDIKYLDLLREYGTSFTIPRMLAMESVKKRLDSGTMTFIEFNYMILQAMDYLELNNKYNCKIQLCGADQWGNCIMGLDLIRRKKSQDVFCLSTALITDSNGNKIGKSAGNAVWVNEDKTSPYDYYQYFRNMEDSLVIKMLKIYTELPLNEIKKMENISGAELNEIKKILAFEATKIAHGNDNAIKAQETANAIFSGGISDNMPSYTLKSDLPIGLLSLLVEVGFASTNSEARRLVSDNAVKINGEIINDVKTMLNSEHLSDNFIILNVGKKKFIKIVKQ